MATTPRKTVKSNPLDSIGSGRAKNAEPATTKNAKSATVKKTVARKLKNQTLNKEAVIQDVPAVEVPSASQKAAPARKRRAKPVEKTAIDAGLKAAIVGASAVASKPVVDSVTDTTAKNMPAASQQAAAQSSAKTVSGDQSGKSKESTMSAEEVLAKEFTPASAMVMIPADLLEDDPLVDVHALHTVKSWSQWAVLGGLIPAPVIDTVAITGVQIKMIHALCNLYHVEFKKEAALAVVSGLVGGTVTTSLAGMGSMFLSHLPVVGSWMKYTAQPVLSYASTYALGRVFMRHFENKGTMADIDSKKLATYFKEQYARGRKMFKYEFKTNRPQPA